MSDILHAVKIEAAQSMHLDLHEAYVEQVMEWLIIGYNYLDWEEVPDDDGVERIWVNIPLPDLAWQCPYSSKAKVKRAIDRLVELGRFDRCKKGSAYWYALPE